MAFILKKNCSLVDWEISALMDSDKLFLFLRNGFKVERIEVQILSICVRKMIKNHVYNFSHAVDECLELLAYRKELSVRSPTLIYYITLYNIYYILYIFKQKYMYIRINAYIQYVHICVYVHIFIYIIDEHNIARWSLLDWQTVQNVIPALAW